MALSKINSNSFAENTVYGRRNLVDNGAMQVSQRGSSWTGLGASTSTFTIDRFRLYNYTGSGVADVTHSTDAPDGFSRSMKIDCTTADTALAGTEEALIIHYIEAQNLQHLQYGTSNAKKITLSFWVKSNKTGTYCAWLYVHDAQDHANVSYTIDTANTWEHKVCTYEGNTLSGGGIANDNGHGIGIHWVLAAGPGFKSGTQVGNTWEPILNADRYVDQTVNIFDNTSNEFYLAGVQLEVGEINTPFEYRNYAEELNICHRYLFNFESSESSGEVDNVFGNAQFWGSAYQTYIQFPTEMRAIPSMVHSGVGTFNLHMPGVFTRQPTSVSVGDAGTFGARVTGSMTYTGTNGLGGQFTADNTESAYLRFRAEL